MVEHLKEIVMITSIAGFFFMLYQLWKKQGSLEGEIRVTMKTQAADIKQIKQRLYNVESEHFMTHEEYEKSSSKCQTGIHNKIDQMNTILSDFIKEYHHNKDQEVKKNLRIETALTRVETIIRERDKL